MFKRILVLIMVLALSSTMVACGGSEGGKSSVNEEGELIDNTYTAGFPIVKEREKLSILVVKQSNHGDLDEMRFTEIMEEKTNLDIEWQTVTPSAQYDRVSLMLASNSTPDIMMVYAGAVSAVQYSKYSKNGTFVELGSKLATWAPNALAAIQEDKSAQFAITTVDGTINALPTIDDPEYPHYLNIRTTWLEQLGLDTPKTTQDLYNILKAFKNTDFNGNGLRDEVPFALTSWHPVLFAPWGLNVWWGSYFVLDKNDQVRYAYTTDNAKEAVSYWNRAYNEGLIDKKLISGGSDEDLANLVKSGVVGAFLWSWPYSSFGNIADEYETIKIPDSQFEGDFNTPIMHTAGGGSRTTYITKNCKNIEAALRFLDYFYTVEGYMVKEYCDAGWQYYNEKDGVYYMTDCAEDNMKHTLSWSMPGIQYVPDGTIVWNENEDKLVSKQRKYELEAIKLYTEQAAKTLPTLAFSEEEIDKIERISGVLATNSGLSYIEKFFNGDRKVGTEWNTYLTEMDNRGVSVIEEVYQTAYDRTKSTIVD